MTIQALNLKRLRKSHCIIKNEILPITEVEIVV